MNFTPPLQPIESNKSIRYKQIFLSGMGNFLIVQIRNSKNEWVNAKAEDFLTFSKGE